MLSSLFTTSYFSLRIKKNVNRNCLEISKIIAHIFTQMIFHYMNIRLGHTHSFIVANFLFLLVFLRAVSDNVSDNVQIILFEFI